MSCCHDESPWDKDAWEISVLIDGDAPENLREALFEQIAETAMGHNLGGFDAHVAARLLPASTAARVEN